MASRGCSVTRHLVLSCRSQALIKTPARDSGAAVSYRLAGWPAMQSGINGRRPLSPTHVSIPHSDGPYLDAVD
jgi:hypothetical protein